MRSMTETDRLASPAPGRALWIALILASGAPLSAAFACVTPFAALATIAALKLSRRDMIVSVTLVWLMNQAVGYGFLHYPWTRDSLAWGAAIGVSAMLSAFAARAFVTARRAPFAVSLPFVAACAVFEFGLYLTARVLPAEPGAFSVAVVGHVLLDNAIVLCAVMAVQGLATLIFGRNDAAGPVAQGA